MRVLTWNINSVRLRLPLLLEIANENTPDVICLQETKCPDDLFPAEEIRAAGFEHQHFWGQKSYNGVAVLSKVPLEDGQTYTRCGQNDCRHISVKINGAVLHNLYIPSGGAGGDLPDPETNPKFRHKLDFVDELSAWFPEQFSADQPMIALGDFNIAPHENDVWSHKQLLKVISHTPEETSRLMRFREVMDWLDSSRVSVPLEEKCYTWWSYRNRDWRKSNRGRRLDHIWLGGSLKDRLRGHEILTDLRDAERPSDHVPVMVDLDF